MTEQELDEIEARAKAATFWFTPREDMGLREVYYPHGTAPPSPGDSVCLFDVPRLAAEVKRLRAALLEVAKAPCDSECSRFDVAVKAMDRPNLS